MSNVAERVKNIIVEKLGVDDSQVTPEASFTNDLGADSLDTVELIMEFEKEFDISIPDEEAENIQTVGQAISYLEKNLEGIIRLAVPFPGLHRIGSRPDVRSSTEPQIGGPRVICGFLFHQLVIPYEKSGYHRHWGRHTDR